MLFVAAGGFKRHGRYERHQQNMNTTFNGEETKNTVAWESGVSQRDVTRLSMARPWGDSRATRNICGRERWHCLDYIVGEQLNDGAYDLLPVWDIFATDHTGLAARLTTTTPSPAASLGERMITLR